MSADDSSSETYRRPKPEERLDIIRKSLQIPKEKVSDDVCDAHKQHCWYTNERAKNLQTKPISLPVLSMELDGVDPSTMDVKDMERLRLWIAFGDNFIRLVPRFVEFAKTIPTFQGFLLEDKIRLVKKGIYEVWMLYASILSSETEIVFEDGSKLTKEQLEIMYDRDFVTHLLEVTTLFREFSFEDDEVALIVAIDLIAHDLIDLEEPRIIKLCRDDLLEMFGKKLDARFDNKKEKVQFVVKLSQVMMRVRQLRVIHWITHMVWLRQHVENLPELRIDAFFVELFDLRPPPEEKQRQQQEKKQKQEITSESPEIIKS